MPTLEQLRVGERENGYRQCYNDMLLILTERLANDPKYFAIINDIGDDMKRQIQIREVSGFAHPEEVQR